MILFGKPLAEKIQQNLRLTVSELSRPPGLAVILLGEHPSSLSYVKRKKRIAEEVGFHSAIHFLPIETPEAELILLIKQLNADSSIDGILTQMPLPKHISYQRVMETIDPAKDVDGFHPLNLGKLLAGREDGLIPCTPLGIKLLLEEYNISVEGKHVVILGRSAIVGKPLAALLVQNLPGCNASVTILHSKTTNIQKHTKTADILVSALGIPRFVKADMVKKSAVVIDVGINRETDSQSPNGYRLIGDVDFKEVEKKVEAITPVPNGVGPMTVAMLLQNTLMSYERRHK